MATLLVCQLQVQAVLISVWFNRCCLQAVAAAALHAVLAAAARPLLQVPPGKRTADEVELLADLLAGLEVGARLSVFCGSGEMLWGKTAQMQL